MQKNVARDGVIDWAKGISIILVLIWHLRPFSIASGSSGRIADFARYSLNLFYEQISLIAVPLFILVSLSLLWGKLDAIGNSYGVRRIRRLISLYAAWTICQFACLFLLYNCYGFWSGTGFSWPRINMSVSMLIMNGGPSLPIVGGSVFYYLFILICLSMLLALFHVMLVSLISPKGRYVLACVTVILCLCYFQWLNWHGSGLPYWRLDNFLVYVPLSYIVWQHEWAVDMVAMLLACFFLFAIQDVYIRSHIGGTSPYSRASVVFGSVTLLAFLRISWPRMRKPPKVITFLSTYSLGLFAIHKYWQIVIYVVARVVARHFNQVACEYFFDICAFFKAISCIILTCVTVYLIGRTSWSVLVR